ncbi:MAG TPA: type II secretion system F family protein [Stellaceae bacterium]|nr:type II secretion system F family protein [Stellaceae bacterium]
MTRYRYEAVSAAGEILIGEMEAETQIAVVESLQNLGHVPLRADIASGSLWSKLGGLDLRPRKGRGLRNLALLTQQLATLLEAGLSLDRALELAQAAMTTRNERECLGNLLNKVRGGSALAEAMAAEPLSFPKFTIGMVRAGEAGASLDTTLRHLAEFLEKSQAARQQIISALIYPMIVLATGGGSIAMLFGFVIPRFRPLFEEAGASLPFAAQMVLGLTDLLQSYWWAILAGLVLAAFILRRQFQRPASRRAWDRALLKMPLVGDLVTKTEVARFARTLGTLLKNGVSPLVALAITEEAIRNRVIAEAVGAVAQSLKQGKGLADPLAQTGVIPALAIQLIRVGEETARLDDMLIKVADIFDQEVGRSVERLLAMLVPATTILLGIVVALVIGSILTAVLSVYELAI